MSHLKDLIKNKTKLFSFFRKTGNYLMIILDNPFPKVYNKCILTEISIYE